MFIYKNFYNKTSKSGPLVATPFLSSTFMPFVEADQMTIKNLAMNHMVIQRDDNSIYNRAQADDSTEKIIPSPLNISSLTYSYWNDDTEFNGMFDSNTEGGNIRFEGEPIEAVVVRRSSARTNHRKWEDIAIIPVDEKSIYTLNKILYDAFIEHGITYQYAIQPVSRTGVRGMQLSTTKRYSYYDDCWILGPNNQQLMVGYNPSVSSVKTIVKDSVIETIGSRYPYIVRNADVGYKQFSFSCTVTYHMNIGESFTSNSEIWVDDDFKKIVDDSTGEDQIAPDEEEESGTIIRLNEAVVINKSTYFRTRPIMGYAKNYNKPGINYENRRFNIQEKDPELTEIYGIQLKKGKWMESEDGTWVGISLPVDFAQDPDPNSNTDAIPDDATHVLAWVLRGKEVEMIQSLSLIPKENTIDGMNASFFDFGANTQITTYDANIMDVSGTSKPIVSYADDSEDSPFENEEDLNNRMEDYLVFDDRMSIADKAYMQEREFRERVMKFLYNGEPKIFKSPTEGLIMVRLTDISFTPKNELGRKIYDFSCTMTEIGRVDMESLSKYNFREAIGDIPLTAPEQNTTLDMKEAEQLYGLFRNI